MHITYFSEPVLQGQLPTEFPSPFSNSPHPLARQACEQLQDLLTTQTNFSHDFHSPGGGKMFGILLVKDANNTLGFLSAFSGKLAGLWNQSKFAPPIFNATELDQFMPDGEAMLTTLSEKIGVLIDSVDYRKLKETLASIRVQYKNEFDQLKVQQRIRKSRRQQCRAMLKISNHPEQNKQLVQLSFESQKDKKDIKTLNKRWTERLFEAQNHLDQFEAKIDALKKQRTRTSQRLHRRVFSHYRLINALGEQALISDFFEDSKPPGGAGDCAAAKLLHHATKNHLTPLALAEFWWGAPPAAGIRHHRHYYPACRGKCRPILPFMLKGLSVKPAPRYGDVFPDSAAPDTLYEDENLLVVNKPEGLLSVPGKEVFDSVLTRIQQRYPNATGPLLVHRLDLSTSGLLLIAKNPSAHKMLQRQFIQRTVEKRYVAILSKEVSRTLGETAGVIELPLRVDFDDRPRQLVCPEHGKPAKTRWEIISEQNGTSRVYFYPHTGRTHQLRVHASHQYGLNAPIVGDNLYGKAADRLYLHAERLRFIDPTSHKRLEFVIDAPF